MTIEHSTRKRPSRGFARWVFLAICVHALMAVVVHRESAHLAVVTASPVIEAEIAIDEAPPAALFDPSSTAIGSAPSAVARSVVNERADPQRPIAIAENHSALEAAAPGETGWTAPVQKAPGASTLPLALGLGAHVPAGQTNINLSTSDLSSVMSDAERTRIVAAEETHRLDVHRERFAGMGIGPWRSAIEGYVPAVRLTNQKSLGPAQKPFVAYLKTMQTRIHPILADDFVEWLRSLPSEHPLRRPHLSTRIEIAIDAMTGAIAKMGVVLASGVTAFDVGVLDAIKRAAPFGRAPDGIASDNGDVYVQWDFTNEPYSACTVANARPSILKSHD